MKGELGLLMKDTGGFSVKELEEPEPHHANGKEMQDAKDNR